MSSSEARRPNYSRRIIGLGVFVVVLCAAYSAGWFYLAGQLETRSKTAIASVNRGGLSLDCDNPTVRGYPFRLGLYCDGVAYENDAERVAVSAQAFRSAAQIYDPFHVVAELDSPARVTVPHLGTLGFAWTNLRSSVRLSTPLPKRISLEVTGLSANANADSAQPSSLFRVDKAEAHMRPNNADLDLALTFDALGVDARFLQGGTPAPLAGDADISITNGVALLTGGTKGLRGQAGVIRMLALSSGPTAGVMISGPFSVGLDGLLDADLKLVVNDPRALSAILSQAFPAAADKIATSFSGLAVLGERPEVPVRIVKGQATLGFIPLGAIPPL